MGALIATANTAKEVGDLCSGQKWARLWAGEESNGEGRGLVSASCRISKCAVCVYSA